MCSGMINKDGNDSSLPRTSTRSIDDDNDRNNEETIRGGANDDMPLFTNPASLSMSNWQSILSVASAHQEAINNSAHDNRARAISLIDARMRAEPPHLLLPLPLHHNHNSFAPSRSEFYPPLRSPQSATSATSTLPLNYNQSINAVNNTFLASVSGQYRSHGHEWPDTLLRYGGSAATARTPHHMFHPISNYGINTANTLHVDQNAFRQGDYFHQDASSTFDPFHYSVWNSLLTHQAAATQATRPDSAQTNTSSADSSQTAEQAQLQPHYPTRSYIGSHVTRLSIPSDASVLDRVNNFLRGECIEIFTVTPSELQCSGGKPSYPNNVGQVGFRCSYCKNLPRGVLAKQANFFPSRRDTIFECVRNFKRSHLEACPCIPDMVKAEYKRWIKSDDPRKKSHQYLRAYYAEAASEIGLVNDTTKRGLGFGRQPNTSGTPSEGLRLLIQAAEHPDTPASVWKTQKKDQAIHMKKFEHIASSGTRNVILNARRTPTDLVYPQDFPTVPDFDFLLLHQLCPIQPTQSVLEKKGLGEIDLSSLSGLCCKYCARANAISGTNFLHKGVYFPTSVTAMVDSSFSQTLLNHIMNCNHVPNDIKSSLDELKGLADTHNVKTRRGIKRRFFEKIWERITNYFNK